MLLVGLGLQSVSDRRYGCSVVACSMDQGMATTAEINQATCREISMTTAEQTRGVFRATDQEIPFLAAQAALELDVLAKQMGSSLKHVRKLADFFADADNPVADYYDPVTSGVVNRALCTYFPPGVESLTDFDARNREIGEILRKVSPGDAETPVERLKDFCLAISQFSSACQSNVYGNRERHPFRK